jgi:hypothetical protein
MGTMRGLGAGVLAAATAGLLVGAVSRLLMRVVTLAADAPGDFSWSGSVGICVTYAAAVLPGALLAAFTSRRYRWSLMVAGALFLCVPAIGVASEEVGGTAGFTFGQWVAVGAAGAGVFATIAVLPLVTVRLVDRFTGRTGRALPGAVRPADGAAQRA